MPKYLVSLVCTEVNADAPDPNLATVLVVTANDRRNAVTHAARVYVDRHIPDNVDAPDPKVFRQEVIDSIVDGFDYATNPGHITHHSVSAFCRDEWFPLRFQDTDDGAVVQGYVVRITAGPYEAVNVTA